VADHAVQRIDRLIGQQPRQAAQQEPEQGRDNPVGKIFGQGFQCGARHAGLIQTGRVAAHDMADRTAPVVERPGQAPSDIGHMIMQAAARNKDGPDNAGDDPAMFRHGAEPGDHAAGACADPDGDRHQRRAQDDLQGWAMAGKSSWAQPRLKRGNQAADPDNGMGYAGIEKFRVAEQQIQREGQENRLNAETPPIGCQNWKNWF